MEKQGKEKKIIKVYQRRRKQSEQGFSFPVDLASEILLRLPEKSVARFRCVSKPWSSLTTDTYFISLFKARSPRLLLCFEANDKLFVSSIPQHHQTFDIWNKSYSSSQPIDRYQMELISKYPNCFNPTESVQGLICFQKLATPIVWNPTTRRLLTLPKPDGSWKEITIFLGYDPVEGKHKVMCMPLLRASSDCRVLTLGSAQESWRTVKTIYNHRSDNHTHGKCIKGVVYYLAFVYRSDVEVVMSFDVKSEKFGKIRLPPSDVHKIFLMVYQDKVACVDRKPNMNDGFRLWILEDAKKHKWSSKDFLAPIEHFNESLGCYSLLNGFTHAGEFIYVVSSFKKSSYILFCDPLRNSFRRFELKGITDDESVLNNNDRSQIYTLHVFLNHVESHTSL
ncbi:hypothetical protein CARUB_v10013896mg [Capsella rubella]|uniref:F-box domain-containing protein n=1 Tax=Capsella rubella TaxID=81985 RepID=R0I320_9BRAS|nr:putative F-box protein At3g10240 [Capsella rubella]EOA30753.1 hypothetical protein CARUB_v10013896mg [Capsella rubella]